MWPIVFWEPCCSTADQMSMGLRMGAQAGTTSRSRSNGCAFQCGQRHPVLVAGIRTDNAPHAALWRGPRGGCSAAEGSDSKAARQSKKASESWTRSMPVRRQTASNTASDPASDPVCEAIACAPASVRPDFTTTTGLLVLALAAAFVKRSPSMIPSRYMPMVVVSSSSARYSSRSDSFTSPLLPIHATLDRPKGLKSAIQRPHPEEKTPDWPMRETPPGPMGSSPTMEVASPDACVDGADAVGAHEPEPSFANLFRQVLFVPWHLLHLCPSNRPC